MTAAKQRPKFTFDTEFRRIAAIAARRPRARARNRPSPPRRSSNLKAAARSEGENSAQARATEALERTIAALTISVRAALDVSHAEIEQVRDEAARLAHGRWPRSSRLPRWPPCPPAMSKPRCARPCTRRSASRASSCAPRPR